MDDLTKEFLIESGEGLDRMERCLADLQSGTDGGDCVAEVFRAVHTIKGTVGFLGFPRLEQLAHAGEHLLVLLRDGKRSTGDGVIELLVQLMDGLRRVLQLIEMTGAEGSRAADNDAELIAKLEQYAKDGVTAIPAGGKFATAGAPAIDIRAVGVKLAGEAVASAANTPGASINTAETTLRVDVETLNRLMNLVGELVQTRNQFLQAEVSEESFTRLGQRLDGVTAELRESVMRARMQPVGQLFQKFPRLVRDVAQICGKNVRLEFSGGDTGLDKSLLEALKDPLTHAVRNAIDHGIETPQQRLLRGKPAEGKVQLRAYHEGGQVVVEVSDDGAGVSRERVLRRAIERGLITAEQAGTMGAAEATQLVFEPGFSTTDEVTMISGRGVGMDVVRANVEGAGGSVELQSVEGEGTTLRMRVPLTLAIVPALVARCGGQMFAVAHSALLEMVWIRPVEEAALIQRIGNAKMFLLRNRLVPLLDLSEVLGIESAPSDGFYIAVLEAKGRQFGLIVDDMAEPQEIVVKPLSSVLSCLNVYSGATLLGDGQIALILDTNGLARTAKLCDGSQQVTAATERVASHVVEMPGVGRAGGASGRRLPLLMFLAPCGAHTVMPLDCVERIEKVAREEIELLSGRAVMQYRGELLALDDPGGLLQQGETAGVGQLVVICNKQGLRAGLVVRGILDVAEGEVLPPTASYPGTVARVEGRLAMFSPGFEPQTGICAMPRVVDKEAA